MNTILAVSVLVIAVCFLFITVILVLTLVQIKRLLMASETLLKQLSNDAAVIGKIVNNISFVADKVSSPWFKMSALLSSMVSSFIVNKFKKG
jgi:uncharacterized protein YoxC